MISYSDVKKKCQKPDYKTQGNWLVRTILRDAAVPVTWLLLHTKITANQVTLLLLLVGLLGSFFLAIPGQPYFLAGMILIQLWYYLDHVDGQIARYRGTATLSGRFFDFIVHDVLHATIFFAPGFSIFLQTGNLVWVILAFTASLGISVFNGFHGEKFKTFFEKLHAAEGKTVLMLPAKSQSTSLKRSWLGRLISFAHKTCEIHVAITLMTVLSLLPSDWFFFSIRLPVALWYGLVCPGLAIMKAAHFIINKKIDEQFAASFLVMEKSRENNH